MVPRELRAPCPVLPRLGVPSTPRSGTGLPAAWGGCGGRRGVQVPPPHPAARLLHVCEPGMSHSTRACSQCHLVPAPRPHRQDPRPEGERGRAPPGLAHPIAPVPPPRDFWQPQGSPPGSGPQEHPQAAAKGFLEDASQQPGRRHGEQQEASRVPTPSSCLGGRLWWLGEVLRAWGTPARWAQHQGGVGVLRAATGGS